MTPGKKWAELSKAEQERLINWLEDGNDKVDLIIMYTELLEEVGRLGELVDEVQGAYDDCEGEGM
jgi:hypothetical protein